MTTLPCPICSGKVSAVGGFEDLPRVTSDCKPWPAGGALAVCEECGCVHKPASSAWQDEIAEIYNNDQIHALANGAEQPIFDADGGSAPRSMRLMSFLKEQLEFAPHGRLVDIGCGNGAALRNFSHGLPGWELNGFELSDDALPFLQEIENFDTLYTGELSQMAGRFDFIAMIHSLEHMLAPQDTLNDALNLLAPGATLFVQVPDIETSPFDLLISDHRVHFHAGTLQTLAERCGYRPQYLSNKVLTKECTLLIDRSEAVSETRSPNPETGAKHAAVALEWLTALLAEAKAAAASAEKFGIFGTSISGAWLYGALETEIDFFVDEDEGRIGKSHFGRPVLSPDDVPEGATVYVPLVPETARNVARRLEQGAKYVQPPRMQLAA